MNQPPNSIHRYSYQEAPPGLTNENDVLLGDDNADAASSSTTKSSNHGMMPAISKGARRTAIFVVVVVVAAIVVGTSIAIWLCKTSRHEEAAKEDPNSIAKTAMARLHELSRNIHLPAGCETTLLLVRHCEDLGGHTRYKDGTKHCSYAGFERSYYLASLFGDNTMNTNNNNHNSTSTGGTPRWPMPSHLYGLDRTPNIRMYETLQPLSVKANIPIHMIESSEQLVDAFFSLLSSNVTNTANNNYNNNNLTSPTTSENNEMICGQVSVVSWKHAYIPALAHQLGCGPSKNGCGITWPDEDFDQVWSLQYVYQPPQLRLDDADADANDSSDKHNNDNHSRRTRRRLKKPAKNWMVYGSNVVYQHFDPLSYSFASGDYQNNQEPGGKWYRKMAKDRD